MKTEVWKPLHGGIYAASNRGRVKRVSRTNHPRKDGVMKSHLDKKGYLRIKLTVAGRPSHLRFVHQCVAEAFYGRRPFGYHIDHRDANKQNNKPENLEYVSARENKSRSVADRTHAHGASHASAKISEWVAKRIKRYLLLGWSTQEVAAQLSVGRSIVYEIKHNRTWRHLQ